MVPSGVEVIVIDDSGDFDTMEEPNEMRGGSGDSVAMEETKETRGGLVLSAPPKLLRGADIRPEVAEEDDSVGHPEDLKRAASAKKVRLAREALEAAEWKAIETRCALTERAAPNFTRAVLAGATGPRGTSTVAKLPAPTAASKGVKSTSEPLKRLNMRQRMAWRAKLRMDDSDHSVDSDFVTSGSDAKAPTTSTGMPKSAAITDAKPSGEPNTHQNAKPRIMSLAEIVFYHRRHEYKAKEQVKVKPKTKASAKPVAKAKATTRPKQVVSAVSIGPSYTMFGGDAPKRQNGKQPMMRRGGLRMDDSDDSMDSDFFPRNFKAKASALTAATGSLYTKSGGKPPKRQNGKQPVVRRAGLRMDDSGDHDADDSEVQDVDAMESDVSPTSTMLANPRLTVSRSARHPSLHFLWESTRARWNLPRPSIRDPPARTFGRTYHAALNQELVPASWPYGVIHFADNFNPENIRIQGSEPYQKCTCYGDCRHDTCVSARTAFYCDERSCLLKGLCGNGTTTNENVRLMRVKNTDIFTLQASKYIGAGVVLGEYLGILSLVSGEKKSRRENQGFRLHFHEDTHAWGSRRLCVDAYLGGSLMRFLNHSCIPTAKFFEVTNRAGRTIVATTVRGINAGEEITVDYGDDLWFDCQCKVCEIRKAPCTM